MLRHFLFLLFAFAALTVLGQKSNEQIGKASFYGNEFDGRTTANGEKYDPDKLTAAHLTLPFDSQVKVVNLSNNKSVTVRINDRGPFIKGRIIDLSAAAAKKLDFYDEGLTKVKLIPLNQKSQNPQKTKSRSYQSRNTVTDKPAKSYEKVSSSPGEIYYEIMTLKAHPSGYGVQVGSFREMVNLLKLTEGISTKYKKTVRIQVGKVKNNKVYRVFVGEFSAKEDAEELKNQLSDTYPGSFVVRYK